MKLGKVEKPETYIFFTVTVSPSISLKDPKEYVSVEPRQAFWGDTIGVAKDGGLFSADILTVTLYSAVTPWS